MRCLKLKVALLFKGNCVFFFLMAMTLPHYYKVKPRIVNVYFKKLERTRGKAEASIFTFSL